MIPCRLCPGGSEPTLCRRATCRDVAPARMPLYTRSFSRVRSLEPDPTDDAIAAPGILIRLSGSQYEKCRLH